MSGCSRVFRHAIWQDKDSIIEFLNQHWGSRHPLVNREEFFEFYYHSREKLQFVLALEDEHIVAVAGYIVANSNAVPDGWVSIWCASGGTNGVGLELMEALPRLAGIRVLACNNIRPKTMAFYRFLGWHADRIPHFYRFGYKESFALIQNPTQTPFPSPQGNLQLSLVSSAEQLDALGIPQTGLLPRKDVWYLKRRYFSFPYQQYEVWAIQDQTSFQGYLITRTVEVPEYGTSVLRIVDFIGTPETLGNLGNAIDTLIQSKQVEYADCYCAGISAEIFAQAGFLPRHPEDSVVVPNYLTPPLLENTEYYYFTNHPENFVLFKADGDQDRPNIE